MRGERKEKKIFCERRQDSEERRIRGKMLGDFIKEELYPPEFCVVEASGPIIIIEEERGRGKMEEEEEEEETIMYVNEGIKVSEKSILSAGYCMEAFENERYKRGLIFSGKRKVERGGGREKMKVKIKAGEMVTDFDGVIVNIRKMKGKENDERMLKMKRHGVLISGSEYFIEGYEEEEEGIGGGSLMNSGRIIGNCVACSEINTKKEEEEGIISGRFLRKYNLIGGEEGEEGEEEERGVIVLPRVMIFAKRDIYIGEELSWDYDVYEIDILLKEMGKRMVKRRINEQGKEGRKEEEEEEEVEKIMKIVRGFIYFVEMSYMMSRVYEILIEGFMWNEEEKKREGIEEWWIYDGLINQIKAMIEIINNFRKKKNEKEEEEEGEIIEEMDINIIINDVIELIERIPNEEWGEIGRRIEKEFRTTNNNFNNNKKKKKNEEKMFEEDEMIEKEIRMMRISEMNERVELLRKGVHEIFVNYVIICGSSDEGLGLGLGLGLEQIYESCVEIMKLIKGGGDDDIEYGEKTEVMEMHKRMMVRYVRKVMKYCKEV